MTRPAILLVGLVVSLTLGNQVSIDERGGTYIENWTKWSTCDSSGMKFRQRTQTTRQTIREVTGCCGNDVRPLKPKDCAEIFKSGVKTPGNYDIWIHGERKVKVACMKDGWTVFQSRGQFGNPQDYFYRGWTEYVNGFGVPGKEHWLGLNNIYDMTQEKFYQLRVTLKDFQRDTGVAFYDNFYLVNRVKYNLHLGSYKGNGGDALTYHNKMAFSTHDRDNDLATGSCAQVCKGGWWYNSCLGANLNGRNTGVEQSNSAGICWRTALNACGTLQCKMLKWL